MKRFRNFLLTIAILSTAGQIAFAQGTPTKFLQSMDKKITPLLANADANKDKIIKHINKMLDFKKLCKDSLGKHWEGKTDAQLKEFTDTLQALIEKNVVKRLKDTKSNKVTYESESLEGKKATVITIVADGDGPRAAKIEIAYKMEKRGNSWKVINMVTDGVSLVSNYRSQFNKLIKKNGWDKMIKKMKDKLADK